MECLATKPKQKEAEDCCRRRRGPRLGRRVGLPGRFDAMVSTAMFAVHERLAQPPKQQFASVPKAISMKNGPLAPKFVKHNRSESGRCQGRARDDCQYGRRLGGH